MKIHKINVAFIYLSHSVNACECGICRSTEHCFQCTPSKQWTREREWVTIKCTVTINQLAALVSRCVDNFCSKCCFVMTLVNYKVATNYLKCWFWVPDRPKNEHILCDWGKITNKCGFFFSETTNFTRWRNNLSLHCSFATCTP